MSASGKAAPGWPALVLTLVVAALTLPNSWTPDALPPAAGHPARLVELLVPGLFAPVTGMAESRSLVTQAILDVRTGPWAMTLPLHVGLTALALALLGLATARGTPALVARLTLVLAALLAWNLLPWHPALCVPLAQAALAVLAGCGLLSLLRQQAERPEMALAVFCLGMTVALVGAALAAGAATDGEALQPFLSALPTDHPAPGPAALAASANVLRHALDDAALASCVCLGAILGLLRWRGPLAASLVSVACAAELLLLSGR